MQESRAGHPQASAPTSGGRERCQGGPSPPPPPRSRGGRRGPRRRRGSRESGAPHPRLPSQRPLQRLTAKGLPRTGSGPERVKKRTRVDPSSSPPLRTVPTRHGGLQPAPRPCPPALPASHHRSSSRLSFCRLPDCTPWAPRPPPPPRLRGREKGCGLSGGGRLAGGGRARGRRGCRKGSVRPGGGAESAERRRPRRQLATLGRGRGRTTSGGEGEMGGVHCGFHGEGRGTTREKGPFSLQARGLLINKNLKKDGANTVFELERRAGFRFSST